MRTTADSCTSYDIGSELSLKEASGDTIADTFYNHLVCK